MYKLLVTITALIPAHLTLQIAAAMTTSVQLLEFETEELRDAACKAIDKTYQSAYNAQPTYFVKMTNL